MRRTGPLTTRLRFEPGQHVPCAGESFEGETFQAGRRVRVHIHCIKRTWRHADGATLIDARVSYRVAEGQ